MVFGPAFFYVRFCHSDHSACLLISCAENATMQHGGPHYEGLLRFFYVICITALGTVTFVFLVTNIIFSGAFNRYLLDIALSVERMFWPNSTMAGLDIEFSKFSFSFYFGYST